jgi:hypothetical protein
MKKAAKKAAKKEKKKEKKQEKKEGAKTTWLGARIDHALKALMNSEGFTRFSTLCYLGILVGFGVDIRDQYMPSCANTRRSPEFKQKNS